MSGRETCVACGWVRDPGAMLLVMDRRGQRPSATVCRPGVSVGCLDWAGNAAQTAIGLLDPAAALEYDRASVLTPQIGARPAGQSGSTR